MKVGDTVIVTNPKGALAEVWAGCTGIVEDVGTDPHMHYPFMVRFSEQKSGYSYEHFAEDELSLATEYATIAGATDSPMDASELEGVMKDEDAAKEIKWVGDRLVESYNKGFEDGKWKQLNLLMPLIKQAHAQLCGVRMKEGKTDYYSALDQSIDELKGVIELHKGGTE